MQTYKLWLVCGAALLTGVSGCGQWTTPPTAAAGETTLSAPAPSTATSGNAPATSTASAPASKSTTTSDRTPPRLPDLSHGAGSSLDAAAGELRPPSGAVAELAQRPGTSVVSRTTATNVPTGGPMNRPELFEGWTKPQFVLVISGEQDGYLEPCGCAGKENMKGGVSRRYTFLEELRGKGWDVVPVDLGGQVKRFGPQSEIKFHMAIDALKKMKYQAIGFGKRDLALPAAELVNETADENSALVAANVGLFDLDSGLTPKFRIIEAGGTKIGVTSVLGDKYRQEINNGDIQFAAAADALPAVIADMKKAGATLLVLLSHATPDESAALAKKFPEFQVVATTGGADEPPHQASTAAGTKTPIVEVGHKGMFVVALGYYGAGPQPWKYQRVPLDNRFAEAPQMKEIMEIYQARLETLGFQNLAVTPIPHPAGLKFVGSQACGDCHTKAMEVWSASGHGKAWNTLAELDVPRLHDPECLSCHVTGWEPQRFLPFQHGYLSAAQTAALKDNGCENCHGPGEKHVAAENGDIQASMAELVALRKSMRLTMDKAEANCRGCHDHDNSPQFEFQSYWEEIAHPGKD